MLKKTSKLTIFFSCFCWLFITSAHAGFREALQAMQSHDMEAMLVEVKDAVDEKNDDGLILFLSLLKQYPTTWRPSLSQLQQRELFSVLEKGTSQSSLQSQYKLAVIPRKDLKPLPIRPETIQENQDEIQRLETVANSGYAYAALHLYGSHVQRYNWTRHKLLLSSNRQAEANNAMKWLVKAAELGNAEAAFVLGMKYLNIMDDFYGCYSYDHDALLCLPKDEAKGWYWMKQAAMQATERNIFLGDFAYHIGNLYEKGIAEQPPDLEQAYLWYRLSANSFSYTGVNWQSKLNDMQRKSQLMKFDPELNAAWGTDRSTEILYLPQKRLPSLLKQLNSDKPEVPVFSFLGLSRINPTIVLDVYADGKIKLLVSDYWADLGNNIETLKVIKAHEVNAFLAELRKLKVYTDFRSHGHTPSFCEDGCPKINFNFVGIKKDGVFRTVKIINRDFDKESTDAEFDIQNNRLLPLKALIEKYFSVHQLLCEADTGESKKLCTKIRQNIIKAVENQSK